MNSATLRVLEDAAAAVIHELGISQADLLNESVEIEAVARAMRRQYLHRWIHEAPEVVDLLVFWGLTDWLQATIDEARDVQTRRDAEEHDHDD
jgi:hypothetical protein